MEVKQMTPTMTKMKEMLGKPKIPKHKKHSNQIIMRVLSGAQHVWMSLHPDIQVLLELKLASLQNGRHLVLPFCSDPMDLLTAGEE